WERAVSKHGDLSFVEALTAKPLATLDSMIERRINAPMGVSAGRLFDAVAAALGIRFDRISYEGQAAIELEALAATAPDETHAYGHDVVGGTPAVIDWSPLWTELLADLAAGVAPARIAARFHNGVIAATVALSERLAQANALEAVALSGGVFQNRLLLDGVHSALEERGLEVLIPRQTPVNDGGLSLGQAAVAAARAIS
ncbi:MAG: carbamoyltransferase HypF, partial [Pirellulales bacterium]|nr:carbamoyltransferase HypF [Pirellulales bacterium]